MLVFLQRTFHVTSSTKLGQPVFHLFAHHYSYNKQVEKIILNYHDYHHSPLKLHLVACYGFMPPPPRL